MEIVFKTDDYAALESEATRLGFVGENGVIIFGSFETGGGWFLNIVGDVYIGDTPVKQNGFWGRLRINGVPTNMPTFSSAVTQYTWSDTIGWWTNDGKTRAPDWIDTIGLIA